ncbi:MAG: threonine synthase, partial [Candidatus Marinimicrobia bacterium]|nr:threonine synthase [Candidatus Neomarinimicrobiota bacterium]
ISNAMDVGRPSNFDRILKIYNENVTDVRRDLISWSFQDDETRNAIQYTKDKFNYLTDPHTAVGLSGIEKFRQEVNAPFTGIALATAHPGKFPQVLEPIIKEQIAIPRQLQKAMEKEKNSIIIPAHYSYLKEFLIHN